MRCSASTTSSTRAQTPGSSLRGSATTWVSGRVDCIEPQPECAAALRDRGDVTVHETVLGENAGQVDLTIYRDTSLASVHTLNAAGIALWDAPSTATCSALSGFPS